MEEESFPRGGAAHSQGRKRKDTPKTEKDLFKVKEDEPQTKRKKLGWKEKSEQKKAKRKAATAADALIVLPGSVGKVEVLARKAIVSDMLLLGCVKEVREFELVVSLANGHTGSVQLTHVSDGYTRLLQQMAEGDASIDEEVCGLSDLFHIGQLVRCRVLDVEQQKDGGKRTIRLSVNPRDVNHSFSSSSMKNGLVLSGCVASREDHGYVIDLGIKGVNAFLKNEAAQEYIDQKNEGQPLRIGQYLDCMVDTPDKAGSAAGQKRVISVSVQPNTVYRSLVSQTMDISMTTLLPGMLFQGEIVKKTEDGIIVKFLKYQGGIHRDHLEKSLRNYDVHTEIKVAVMYIHPTSKVVALTQLPHLVTHDLSPQKLFGDITIGDILEEVAVRFADQHKGVFLNLGERITGHAKLSDVSDEKVKDLQSSFSKGSKHRCRVLRLDYIDRVVQVSMKKSVIEQQFLKYADIQPGVTVECTIRGFHLKGVSVTVTNYIHGLIPKMHLADIPLKHPEKRFQVKDKLKCKVLEVNPASHRLILTNKKSLVTSKLPVVTSYSDCHKGDTIEGFVALIKQNGVLVVFYNGIKGWVPKSELSTETIEYPEKVFFPGQVVKCRVLNSLPPEEKLLLSLKLEDKPSFGSKVVEVPEDYEFGKLVDCRVSEVTDKGLDVRLLPSKVKAFLPKVHLSDHLENWDLLLEMYKKGDVIKDVMYIGRSQVITLTKKTSLIKASEDGRLVTDFSELKPGILLPGVVKKIMTYGVFLDMLNGLVGLVPNKYLCDRKLSQPSTLYREGQTLMAKVVEVDEDKKRFLLSVRGSDCFHGDTDQGLDLLEDYLKEHSLIMTALKSKKSKKQSLAEMHVGEVVKATVSEVTKHGVLCRLQHDMKGFVTQDNMPGVKCDVGQKLDAVVLFVDLQASCVELSLDGDLIKSVRNFKDNKYSKAKEDQMVKSEVQLIKPCFILVSLKGHTSGRFAYLPAKRHLGDTFSRCNFCVGQINQVIIKRVAQKDEVLLGSLQIHEAEMEQQQAASQHKEGARKTPQKHGLKLGMLVTATVQKVHQHQMNVTVNSVPGRVHITEVLDDVTQPKNPLDSYHVGQEIQAKIIGFREVTSYSFLPISSPKVSKALPELTLKPSKLVTKGLQKGEEVQGREYKIGDEVNAFVTGYHHRCLWVEVSATVRGKAYFLNASDNLKVLETPASHFKEGFGFQATVIGKEKGILELSFTGQPTEIKEGAVVKGYVLYTDPGHGLSLHLGQGYKGHVALTDIADAYEDKVTGNFHADQVVRCYVLKADKKNKDKCVLSLRPSRCCQKPGDIVDKECDSVDSLTQGQILRGYVSSCTNQGVFISITRDVTSRVQFSHASQYFLKEPETIFYPGKLVTAKILSISSAEKKVELSLLEKDTGQPENIPLEYTMGKRDAKKTHQPKPSRKRQTSVGDGKDDDDDDDDGDDASEKKKQKTKKERKAKKLRVAEDKEEEEEDSGIEASRESDSDFDTQLPKQSKNTEASPSTARLSLSAGFSWDGNFTLPVTPGGRKDSDSEDAESDTEQKKPKKTRQERQEERKQEEKLLFETEKQLMSGDQAPRMADDFDRLVLQSPNSSLVWLRYMAFHLETTEIEKARAVAERALKTISFREEQEKFNVWVAYLNLENMFGTAESLKGVFDRALQHNEPIKISQQLINIYVKSEKMEAAERLYQTLVRKYSLQKEVWVQFGLFYFQQDKAAQARKVMQRSLKSLDKKDHVEVLSKFSQMEFKHGDSERGKTMFESILGNYPKRTDLWSVYIDMVTKLGDLDPVRALFERVIHLNISAKKMKFFFKKYLEFEQKHGTEETVRCVKEKAVDYVESRGESS